MSEPSKRLGGLEPISLRTWTESYGVKEKLNTKKGSLKRVNLLMRLGGLEPDLNPHVLANMD